MGSPVAKRVFQGRRTWRLSEDALAGAVRLIAGPERRFRPDVVIGLARGGLLPARAIAAELGVRFAEVAARHNASDAIGVQATGEVTLDEQQLAEAVGAAQTVLLVDDICGSGATLSAVTAALEQAAVPAVRTAVLCRNGGATFPVDAWVYDVDDWVRFFWEDTADGANDTLLPIPHHLRTPTEGTVSTIAFVLFSYGPNEPAGYERSVGALAEGCRQLGIDPLIITAGPDEADDHLYPEMVRMESLTLRRPILKPAILAALQDPEPVRAELRQLLADHDVELVVWVDALYGLGYLDAAPPATKAVLQIHKVRADDYFDQAVAAADVVAPISPFMLAEARREGYETEGWPVIPNALLSTAAPVPLDEREWLRLHGPVRIVSRAEPYKGLAELLEAMPEDWDRPIELVLAKAGFEYWPGMQQEVFDAVRAAAAKRPDVVRVLDPLPWQEVQGFFSGAAATVIASYEPETFCNAAAEAMSTGAPVVGFGIGNLPFLVEDAGLMVRLDSGCSALWAALAALLGSEELYHAASHQAPLRTAAHGPAEVVRALRTAAGLPASAH
ncbi:MAG: phosphoribosyltransferase family protein [Pseudonocardiaceae bacterium]